MARITSEYTGSLFHTCASSPSIDGSLGPLADKRIRQVTSPDAENQKCAFSKKRTNLRNSTILGENSNEIDLKATSK